MEHLSGMAAHQSEEIVGNLRSSMNELADMCIMRTQFLAGSVFELSNANRTRMESVTQQFMAMNEIVGQVQYLSGSDHEVRASMEQGGWLDNYLTERGQHTEGLGNKE